MKAAALARALQRLAKHLQSLAERLQDKPEPPVRANSWFSHDPDQLPDPHSGSKTEGRLAFERRMYGHSYFGPLDK